jgi:hypothetical protein
MNRINKIPYHLLNSFKYYIKNNEKMNDTDLFDLMGYYPKSYKKGIICYRIIGCNTSNEPIITKKDSAWSKDVNYPFTIYLDASDFYHKFEGFVDGFDLTSILHDCKMHKNPEIQDLSRFAKEQEVIAFNTLKIKYLGQVFDSALQIKYPY